MSPVVALAPPGFDPGGAFLWLRADLPEHTWHPASAFMDNKGLSATSVRMDDVHTSVREIVARER
jgi:hypothetical protein